MNDMKSIKYTLLLLLFLNILFSKNYKKNDIYLSLIYRNPTPQSNLFLSIKTKFVILSTDNDRFGNFIPVITLNQGKQTLRDGFSFYYHDNSINLRKNGFLYVLRGRNAPITPSSTPHNLNSKKHFKMRLKLLDKYKNVISPDDLHKSKIEFFYPVNHSSLSNNELDSLRIEYNLDNLVGSITNGKFKNEILGCKLIYDNNKPTIICATDYESIKTISLNNTKPISKKINIDIKPPIIPTDKSDYVVISSTPPDNQSSNNSNSNISTNNDNPSDKNKPKIDIPPILPNTNELGKSPSLPVVNKINVADILLPDSKDITINERTIINDPHSLIYISNGNSMRKRNFNWYSIIRNILFEEFSNSHYRGSRLSIATGADSSTSSIYMPFTNGGAKTEELKNAEIKAAFDRPPKETQNLYEILIKSQSLLGSSDKIKYQNLDLIIFFATEWSFSPNSIDKNELKSTLDSLSKTFNNIHLICVSENTLSRNKEFDENFVSILSERPDILRHDIVKENIEMIGEKLKSFVKSKS